MLSESFALFRLLDGLLGKGGQASKAYREARERDKKAAVRWILGVRGCVQEVKKRVERKQDPTEVTAELAAYAWNNKLPLTVRKLLGEQRTKSLQSDLRRLHASARSMDLPSGLKAAERARLIKQLAAASGQLTALAKFAEAN